MRPVNRGDVPTDANGNPVRFSAYGQARDPLIAAIGDFCSYCETALHSTIDVEHVQPKKGVAGRPDLELAWENFLLACSTCNRAKWHTPIVLNQYYWPDSENTFRAFTYAVDEPPEPASGVTGVDPDVARRMIELTGLDRKPGHPDFSDRDRRFGKRKDAWGNALLALGMYRRGDVDPLGISLMAVPRGFFSVWMTVFQDYPEVRRVLIAEFKAASDCFDANTTACPRPSGQI